jgi:hypothetical protein
MDKFCVFCGEAPQDKNKEHVLPNWLIEMTGNPKRVATFGIDFTKKPFAPRKFAFDSLVFPACSACNARFGKLEQSIKPIFEHLLANQPLGAGDLILLLDWLDKVRVGLWLGYLYLNKNLMGIEPNFHIESRIGLYDRMVSILRMEDASAGLTFIGPEFKTYQLSPTCFGLRVNELWFVNASGMTLCSQRLGFPYMQPVRVREDHQLEASPKLGSGRIMNPVERIASLPRAVALYQPIFRLFCEREDRAEFLENDWVRERTANIGIGYGKLFQQKSDSVQIYPDEESSNWVPSDSWKKSDTPLRLAEHVCGRIRREYENAIRLTSSKELRQQMRRQAAMTGMVDHAMLRQMR